MRPQNGGLNELEGQAVARKPLVRWIVSTEKYIKQRGGCHEY